jgi:hypothetical protein
MLASRLPSLTTCCSYLRFEWEARKRADLDARLLTQITETTSAAASAATVGEDAKQQAAFDEGKFRQALEAGRKSLFESVPVIKCKVCCLSIYCTFCMMSYCSVYRWLLHQVPMQANGFDCGLFVTKFAEMVLRRQPASTAADIADKFATLLPVSDFSQQDVDLERVKMRNLIDRWGFDSRGL